MKRSFQTANENTQDSTNSLNGIGPTTAQAQGPNAQAEQATNQLTKPSLPFTLTEKGLLDSLGSHGDFCIPFDLITRIIQSFPSIEMLVSRTVSKPFCLAWGNAAKNLLFISKPAIHHFDLEQVCNTLYEQQRAEVKYLIKNKADILRQNNNDSRLINTFTKLIPLENNTSLVAYHAKEKLLTSLNETIIRIGIAKTQQSNKPKELYLTGCHLTRFPESIFSDPTLAAFWGQVTKLYVPTNQLSTLPDAIGQCAALRLLVADNNQLTSLPDTIGQCSSLQRLIVNANQLITLPDTIGQCAALQLIDVGDNQLTTLPDTLGRCAKLWHLCVTENKLTELPTGLRDDIFYDELQNKISKAQSLALQKEARIITEEGSQGNSPMRP